MGRLAVMDSQSKSEIRKKLLIKRRNLSLSSISNKSSRIARRIIKYFDFTKITLVHSYLPLPGEVDTKIVISAIKEINPAVKIAVPIVSGDTLVHSLITEDTLFHKGSFNTQEPNKIIPVDFEQIKLVFIPIVGFDVTGNRIGYGKGYYDSFLSKLNKTIIKIGLAFDLSLVKEGIISEPHDVRLDYAVTEYQIFKFD